MRPFLPLAAAVALAITAPALAQAPRAAATPLQTQLAAKLLDFIDYKASVRARMTGSTLPPQLVAVRPEWDGIWRQAMAEELDHDMPTVESMVGQALVKTFTDDEMKAGLQIVSDPALKAIYLAARIAIMTPSPGHVGQYVTVKMERPRDRNSPLFDDFKRRVMTALDRSLDHSVPDREVKSEAGGAMWW